MIKQAAKELTKALTSRVKVTAILLPLKEQLTESDEPINAVSEAVATSSAAPRSKLTTPEEVISTWKQVHLQLIKTNQRLER